MDKTDSIPAVAKRAKELTRDEINKFLASKSIDILDFIRPSIDETLLMGLVAGEAITQRDKTNIQEAGNRGKMADKLLSLIQEPRKFSNFRKVLIKRGDEYLEDLLAEHFPHPLSMGSGEAQSPPVGVEEGTPRQTEIAPVTRQEVEKVYAENKGEEPYKMSSKPRGRAIIFNFNKIKGFKERFGSLVDTTNLELLFTDLGFKVETHIDYSQSEVREVIKKEQHHKDHESSDAFVMCIMSHGYKGYVADRDAVRMNIMETFLDPFKSNIAKHLANKPKLFFIQACRGDVRTREQGIQIDEVEEDAFLKRAHEVADILIGYAAAEGYPAYRSSGGSIFINELVSVFRERCHKDQVSDMTTVVTDRMCSKPEIYLSSTTSQLRRKLYFFPGYSEYHKSGLLGTPAATWSRDYVYSAVAIAVIAISFYILYSKV